MAPAKKTPKKTPTKRAAAPDTTPKSAKRRNTRKSDPGDPFNFDAKKDEHPDLLEKVQVERQSFGGMKFYNKDNKDGSKYANLEKNASERRQLVPELLVKSPLPSLSNSTPKSTKSTKSTPSSAKRGSKNTKSEKNESTAAVDFDESESEPEEKPTPKSAKKKKPAEEAVVKTPKVEVQIPVLTAEEQYKVDSDKQTQYPAGARVFVIWANKEYYSAVVADRDGFGRYKVYFMEDQSERKIPSDGVVPLYLIQVGTEVNVLGEKDEDGDNVVYQGKVLGVPSIENPEEWFKGVYSIEVSNEEHPDPETRDVNWFDICLTEAQYKQIKKTKRNPTELGKENIIEAEDGRRTRRSRASAVAPPTTTPTPKSKPTPKKKVTPKTEEPEKEEPEKPTETPKAKAKPAPKPKATPKAKATPKNTKKKVQKEEEEEEADDQDVEMKDEETENAEAAAEKDESKEEENVEKLDTHTEESQNDEEQKNGVHLNGDIEEENKPNGNHEKIEDEPLPIFEGMYFILTSANRQTGPPPFTKKDVRKAIEHRAGNVIESFEGIKDDDKVYLIADTYYRTHKYLTALSLSIPTVSFKWIEESVAANKLLDCESFMLDAGESTCDSKKHPWKPLKGKIFPGKRIAIFSQRNVSDSKFVNFREIWSPMVGNVGGTVVGDIPTDLQEIEKWFENNEKVDYFMADEATPKEIIDLVTKNGSEPVTSEWLIQCIVTGEIVPPTASERYQFKA